MFSPLRDRIKEMKPRRANAAATMGPDGTAAPPETDGEAAKTKTKDAAAQQRLAFARSVLPLLDAAARIVELQPLSSIGDLLSHQIQQQVNDYVRQTPVVQAIRWLTPIAIGAVCGGAYLGSVHFDGLVAKTEAAADRALSDISGSKQQIVDDAKAMRALVDELRGKQAELAALEAEVSMVRDQVGATDGDGLRKEASESAKRIGSAQETLNDIKREVAGLQGVRDAAALIEAKPPSDRAAIGAAALVLWPYVGWEFYALLVSLGMTFIAAALALIALRRTRR